MTKDGLGRMVGVGGLVLWHIAWGSSVFLAWGAKPWIEDSLLSQIDQMWKTPSPVVLTWYACALLAPISSALVSFALTLKRRPVPAWLVAVGLFSMSMAIGLAASVFWYAYILWHGVV